MNTESKTDSSHRRIPVGPVLELCGGISAMTLHRWLNNPDLNFPKPQYLGRRRYWRESDIIQWLDAQADQRGAA